MSLKSSQAEELFCTNANTNPSGLELSVLGLEEVEGSVKAKTKPRNKMNIFGALLHLDLTFWS